MSERAFPNRDEVLADLAAAYDRGQADYVAALTSLYWVAVAEEERAANVPYEPAPPAERPTCWCVSGKHPHPHTPWDLGSCPDVPMPPAAPAPVAEPSGANTATPAAGSSHDTLVSVTTHHLKSVPEGH